MDCSADGIAPGLQCTSLDLIQATIEGRDVLCKTDTIPAGLYQIDIS